MSSWINLGALWRITVVGLLAGAGLPALFAVGLRALYGRTVPAAGARADGISNQDAITGENVRRAPSTAGVAVAVVCFAVVAAAIVWGIWSIVGHR
jgi:hypothetical protein